MLGFRAALLIGIPVVMTAAGCGLRSEPSAELACDALDDSEGTGGTGDTGAGEPRHGSCLNPISIPYGQPLSVSGRLGGCSESDGWCGADRGPEDVYLISQSQQNPIDVVLRFDSEATGFEPTIRVVRDDGQNAEFDPCVSPAVLETEVCGPDATSRSEWVFNAPPGDYYVIVDSPGFTATTDYKFSISYGGNAVPQDCPTLPDTIVLGIGGTYIWEDTVARSQGNLDGALCPAPGFEHTWHLQLKNDGLLTAMVEGQDGLEPIISLRAGCGGNQEIACDNSTSENGTAKLTQPMPAGNYLLAVDQQSVTGGPYTLTVSLD